MNIKDIKQKIKTTKKNIAFKKEQRKIFAKEKHRVDLKEAKDYLQEDKERKLISKAKKVKYSNSPLGKISSGIKSNMKKNNKKKTSVFSNKVDKSVYEIKGAFK